MPCQVSLRLYLSSRWSPIWVVLASLLLLLFMLWPTLFHSIKSIPWSCFNFTISAPVTVSPASIGGVAPGVSIIVDVGTLVELLAIVGGGNTQGFDSIQLAQGCLSYPQSGPRQHHGVSQLSTVVQV